MLKRILLLLAFIVLENSLIAQKGTVIVSGIAGATVTLTESSFYKPGLHLMGLVGYGVNSSKQDAVTAHVGYHSFINKRATGDVVKMMDIKIGFRFFPSANVPVYLHPNVGVGFFADGSGRNASASAGIMLGYLPKIGGGNINVFAGFNRISFTDGISLFNLGAGYQFKFKRR